MSLTQAIRNSIVDAPRESSPGVLEADFVFTRDFVGFSGHFPGNPILPGIAQIVAAVITVSPNKLLSLREVRRAKFLRIVRPGETLRVRAESKPGRDHTNNLLVTARLAAQGEDCAYLTLLLDKDKP